MIEALDDLPLENIFQLLQVVDHARHRVGLAFERHFQNEIVTVPVGVGFGAVESLVLWSASAGLRHTWDAENSALRVISIRMTLDTLEL